MFNKKPRKTKEDSKPKVNPTEDSDVFDISTVSSSSTVQINNNKKNIKKAHLLEYSSSDEEDWKTEFTRSIRKDDTEQKEEAPKTKTSFKRKYPKEATNLKAGLVQVKSKDNSNSRFQDLCAICLDKYSNVRGQLGCGHKFCYECIQEWIKSSTRCPCCRQNFAEYVKIIINEKNVQKKREIIKVEEKVLEFSELDWYVCYECGNGDDEDVLLVCDVCEFYCCHVYCDPSLHNVFPEGDWQCQKCKQMLQISIETAIKNSKATIKEPKKQTKKPQKRTKKSTYTESSSDEQQHVEPSAFKGRITRSMSNIPANFQTRSKAYEIMNMRPSNTAGNFAAQMDRVNNSTAMNLRNLRRRRIQ